ncbi:MAG: hypothetical protein DWB42_03045 [Chloroflexi bacterium]|nr:hypothetical protein [Chloroflexota bacterium]MDL1885318.1 phosphoribosyltransferase [Anaerolineae bacterium CFX8]
MMTINMDYWRQPEGVPIPGDELKFLYIPDDVEAYMTAELAWQVYDYQKAHAEDGRQITKAVMVTMGGLLPGVLLHDHIAWSAKPHIPPIEFGTLGVQCYAGPGKPLDQPRVIQALTINVSGHVVAVVEDLVDLGGTARFVRQLLLSQGARDAVLIAPFMKNTRMTEEMEVIWFSVVPKDTWIITPRERVETLLKRVPYWRQQGAALADCEVNLRRIGYPDYLIERYLEVAYGG